MLNDVGIGEAASCWATALFDKEFQQWHAVNEGKCLLQMFQRWYDLQNLGQVYDWEFWSEMPSAKKMSVSNAHML